MKSNYMKTKIQTQLITTLKPQNTAVPPKIPPRASKIEASIVSHFKSNETKNKAQKISDTTVANKNNIAQKQTSTVPKKQLQVNKIPLKGPILQKTIRVEQASAIVDNTIHRSFTNEKNFKAQGDRYHSVPVRLKNSIDDRKCINVKLESNTTPIDTIKNSNDIEPENQSKSSALNDKDSEINHEVSDKIIKEYLGSKANEISNRAELSEINVDTNQAVYAESKLSRPYDIKTIEQISNESSSKGKFQTHSETKLMPTSDSNNEIVSIKKSDRIMYHTDSKLLKRNKNKVKPFTDEKRSNLQSADEFMEGYKSKRVNRTEDN